MYRKAAAWKDRVKEYMRGRNATREGGLDKANRGSVWLGKGVKKVHASESVCLNSRGRSLGRTE